MIYFLYISAISIIIVPSIIYLFWLFLKPTFKLSPTEQIPTRNSIILPIFNEEKHINEKIISLLQECESSQLATFEIIIISDGSEDETNHILESWESEPRIKSIFLSKRIGKPTAINTGVKLSKHPILVLIDARQKIVKGSLMSLLTPLQDLSVGAVSAQLNHGKRKSRIRDTINQFKILESKKGGSLGVYGPLYALRKNCFKPLEIDILLDDLYLSLHVLSMNKRILFAKNAQVSDVSFESLYRTNRIKRISCGLVQLLFSHRNLLRKLNLNKLLLLFIHKYYRYLILPLFLFLSYLSILDTALLEFHMYLMIGIFILAILFSAFKLMYKIFILYLNYLNPFQRDQSILWEKDTIKG